MGFEGACYAIGGARFFMSIGFQILTTNCRSTRAHGCTLGLVSVLVRWQRGSSACTKMAEVQPVRERRGAPNMARAFRCALSP